jgi:hypothetical protein
MILYQEQLLQKIAVHAGDELEREWYVERGRSDPVVFHTLLSTPSHDSMGKSSRSISKKFRLLTSYFGLCSVSHSPHTFSLLLL